MTQREQRFTVTEAHIKLLRAARVSWWSAEFGAPCIDPKRPYGNSNVYSDMLRILHDKEYNEDAGFGTRLAAHFDDLHRETETALQIFLATGAMEPGEYVAPLYTAQWRKP